MVNKLVYLNLGKVDLIIIKKRKEYQNKNKIKIEDYVLNIIPFTQFISYYNK